MVGECRYHGLVLSIWIHSSWRPAPTAGMAGGGGSSVTLWWAVFTLAYNQEIYLCCSLHSMDRNVSLPGTLLWWGSRSCWTLQRLYSSIDHFWQTGPTDLLLLIPFVLPYSLPLPSHPSMTLHTVSCPSPVKWFSCHRAARQLAYFTAQAADHSATTLLP